MSETDNDDDLVKLQVPKNATIILILPYGENGEGLSALPLQHRDNDLPEDDREFFKALAKGMCTLAVSDTKMVLEAAMQIQKEEEDGKPEEQVTAETDLSKAKIKGRA